MEQLQLEDMTIVESHFQSGGEPVTTGNAGTSDLGNNADSWVYVYEARNVTFDDWGVSDGVVRLKVVFEDESGRLRIANASRTRAES